MTMNIKSLLILLVVFLGNLQLKGQVRDSCSLVVDSLQTQFPQNSEDGKFPDWIQLATSDEFCIGVSDPYMDSDMALEQAKLRAVAIACLKKNLAYRSIVDNYTSDKKERYASSKFVSLTNVLSAAQVDLKSLPIEKSFTSSFDEVFVLVNSANIRQLSNECDSTNTIRISADLLQSEIKGSREESYSFIKLYINTPKQYPIKELKYYSYNTQSGKDIVSKINQFEIKFPSGIFRYQPFQKSDTTAYQNGMIDASLHYSFWNAYLDVILNNLLLMTKEGGKVKSVGDQYNTMFKNLFRVVDYQKMKFSIADIKVEGNRLYMKTDF
ncbi:hypothetical protein [Marinifilum sp. D737]|uniref:hypothetical protein n=1 Tax=Marinifilum sp. D737 TaxID=2969628 RepID=UPI0022727121|nr:hypothetical protein [Marinifilum sp. D737]MCY1635109.1 hypothetical protein [Marinifilum sp. D737]